MPPARRPPQYFWMGTAVNQARKYMGVPYPHAYAPRGACWKASGSLLLCTYVCSRFPAYFRVNSSFPKPHRPRE